MKAILIFCYSIQPLKRVLKSEVVSLVRQEAGKIAERKGFGLILTAGPAKVGCPVIAAIGGAAGVLIVTEPTVPGKHDMGKNRKSPGNLIFDPIDIFDHQAAICHQQ